ncbi:wnt inhibitory factor 1-like [Patiria miniata]|uniref:WIF domain-containing protein n=1 Tax=Patiria miniata TaxID=46514 RepID=A0A913ZC54_PATMI|nr:wnt inhibitory factor 1-like [Patiria miniata]
MNRLKFYQIVLMVVSTFFSSSLVSCSTPETSDKDGVSIWIDPQQAQRLSCRGANLYILQEGKLGGLIRTISKWNGHRPTIPADIPAVNVTWQAPPDYKYQFQLRSYTRNVMRTPKLNIPRKGTVPQTESKFQIELPCVSDGLASIMIALRITDATRTRMPGSPIALELRKECRLDDDQSRQK